MYLYYHKVKQKKREENKAGSDYTPVHIFKTKHWNTKYSVEYLGVKLINKLNTVDSLILVINELIYP